MRARNKLISTTAALSLILTSFSNAALLPAGSDVSSHAVAETQLIIKVENPAKTRAIIRRIESGAAKCRRLDYDERTRCLGSTYYRAAQTARQQRFGGPAARILSSGGRKLDRLPRDGSKESFRNAEKILDAMAEELRKAAPTRPNDWGKYYLQVSVAVVKSKKVFTRNKG